MADGRLTVIPGAYHSPQLTHPEQWSAAVEAHLEWAAASPVRAVTDTSHPPQASDRIALAGSDVSIPPLGVGTWAWGDKGTWGMGGYDQSLTESTIREAWEASIEAGVVLFDTAEIYGRGESERIIGRLLAAEPGRPGPGRHRLEVHAQPVEAERALGTADLAPGTRSSGWGSSPSTCTRSTARPRCARTTPWPRPSRRRTPRVW